MSFSRREFLRASTATALGIGLPGELFAQAGTAPASPGGAWDAGLVRHLLPTVSDTRMLIKASFNAPLTDAPTLRVGDAAVRGRMGDTSGEHWHFYASDLSPGRRYPLSLAGADGRALCQPWELATFPGPDERPSLCRLLIYSCAGGHEAFTFLPTAVRNRLLRRGLSSFEPDAAVANGDHVYWDLLSPFDSRVDRWSLAAGEEARREVRPVRSGDRRRQREPCSSARQGRRSAGLRHRLSLDADIFLAGRSRLFRQRRGHRRDHHLSAFALHAGQLARATQNLYYPEFLPDAARPLGLPWSSAADRPWGVSESFGTIRYGRLAEILL